MSSKLSLQTHSAAFEVTAGLLIFAPIVYFLTGLLFGQSLGLFLSFAFPLGLLWVLLDREKIKNFRSYFPKLEVETFCFFLVCFAAALWFCLLWPDFIAMGERLRDYALLASVVDSPLEAREPWMVGENLNYYLFWYRFAAYWSMIFGLSVWTAYHFLAAFCFALFSTTLFRLSRCYLKLSFPASLLFALLIPFGSNLAGVLNAFTDSSDWWGPSRVIKGTINEFPAWSFLLGDLHPHFLNLATTPLVLCFALAIAYSGFNWACKLVLSLALFATAGVLHYNTNAWEVPMAAITFAVLLSLLLLAFFPTLRKEARQFFTQIKSGFSSRSFPVLLFAFFLSVWSLVVSSLNLKPADYPWHRVIDPIPQSRLPELLMHWGVPLAAILFALFLRLRTNSKLSLLCAAIFAVSVATQNATFLLLAFILWIAAVAHTDLKAKADPSLTLQNCLLYALGISSFILLLLSELIFLDDPYGGENERMNTVFKVYAAIWGPMHLFAFTFCLLTMLRNNLQHIALTFGLLLLSSLPAFFIHTIHLRKNWAPSSEGLASVEQQFAGAADAIRFLRAQPRQTVLEAQGPPYSYTSHVATLGNQASFLGWSNHVGLLTGNHGEVGRRESVTDQIYKDKDCNAKLALAKKEGIKLIVVGVLEKQKYGNDLGDSFFCFEDVFSNSGYTIFKVI